MVIRRVFVPITVLQSSHKLFLFVDICLLDLCEVPKDRVSYITILAMSLIIICFFPFFIPALVLFLGSYQNCFFFLLSVTIDAF